MASGNLRIMPEVKDMAAANSRFMLGFLNKTEQKSDNIIFAPYSISTALAMTCKGAGGDTAKEMKSVLKWASEDVPTSGFGQYLTLLQEAAGMNTSGYILVGAQRIYVNGKLSVKPDFSADIQKHFVSDAQQADFANNSDGERVNINTWVSEQTRGKINDLLPSGSITPLTAMVLLQATYFKGNWMHKFDAANTREADFHSPKGTVRVNMMRQTTKFPYVHWEKLGCAAVELPYASNNADSNSHDLSMLILLPDARDGLERLESSLTYEKLQEIRGSLRSVKVELQLPRFKVESSFQLKGMLSDLGMPLAFSDKADFSGMVSGPAADLLYISEVFHKAMVEVNEEGSEAAATTGVVMAMRSMPIIEPFIADHPFLFLIMDKRADVVLFFGHVIEPSSSAPSQSVQQQKQEL